jgi:gamma-glutamylcyclotransferase (GGCT)/AIG2-like uncharacterized protein YtfP
MNDYLFAYGTLAESRAPREIAAVMRRLKSAGEGFVFGRLYDAGQYPGARLDDVGGDKIFGKIFVVPNDEPLLAKLDDYEGFDPGQPKKSLFVRRRTVINRSNGVPLNGWIYEYNRDVRSLPVIKSGHYSKISA